MKVLMFGWEYPPFISGGLGTACFGLTQGLVQRGADMVFVVPKLMAMPDSSSVKIIDGAGIRLTDDNHAEVPASCRILPVDSFLLPYMNKNSYDEALKRATEDKKDNRSSASWELYGPDLYSEVFRYGKIARVISARESFDVIHVHDWMTIPAGIEAKEKTGKPLIVHIHSLESDRSAGRINERIYGVERLGMMKADQVIAVSHYTKRKIVDQYGIRHEKITVVHNAVSRNESGHRYNIKRDPTKKYVLFLGRITYQKGPDYFLEAARKILAHNSTIHFVMAGSGDMTGRIKDMALRFGIENNVHFTGFLRGADVEKAYAMSDLYVMPSVSEPFGIAALEAIQFDVPVIISKQSGVSEVISSCPKVDFWNTDELAKRIMTILEDENLRDDIVKTCKEELESINWQIAADKIINVYHEVMVV